MKLKPLNDRVIVVRVDQEQKTAGGIIIPDTAKEKPQEGKIVVVGPGKLNDKGKRVEMEVKKGDMMAISPFCVSFKFIPISYCLPEYSLYARATVR